MKRAALLGALAVVAACGGSTDPGPPEVRRELEARLTAKKLTFEWVYCLRTELEHDGRAIFRCNVNFGEPHIVIYCATLAEGELVTNRDLPEIRCGRGQS